MSSVATFLRRKHPSSVPEKRLSAQRRELQEEIIRLLDSSIDSKEKELLLQGKKAAYNQVMDKLQPYRAGANPIDKFPTEILEIIFLDYMTVDDMTDDAAIQEHVEKRVSLLLPLTMVSKQWRNYIYSAPILWDCIHADGKKGDAVARVVQGLKLSGDRPLTIILKIWSSQWKQICRHLIDHRDRIVTFIFWDGYYDYGPNSPGCLQGRDIIRDLFPLPNLRTAKGTWGHVENTLREMLIQSRSLECLRGFYELGSEWLLKAQNNVAIQEICTQQDFALLLPVLESIPSIHEFANIIIFLHELQCLREFRVWFEHSSGNSTSLVGPISPIKPNHTIRHLELNLQMLCLRPSMTQEEKDSTAAVLFEALLQATPAIESLDYAGGCTILSRWKLDTYDELERLTINILGLDENGDVHVHVHFPDSVRMLLLVTVKGVYKLTSSPNIRNLDMTCRQKTFMDLREWPALEVMTLHEYYSRFIGASFSSLRKITFKALSYSKVTSFIKEIAEAVDHYPCLEEIHMDECPEWDILMIMLERRNILAVPRVRPISRLSLPSTCPSSVSQLLPELLAGKWIQRPSNFELSQAGNAENILGLVKPGCFACLKSLRECDVPLKPIKPWGHGDIYNPMSKLQHYPTSENEILSTWQERAASWEYVRKPEEREGRCTTQSNRVMKRFDANSSPHLTLAENPSSYAEGKVPSRPIDSTSSASPNRSSPFNGLKKFGKFTMKSLSITKPK
ncbi:hypothetical protein CPB86DRAFT_869332 [Serendipita vermifera]|nr:hypothetical protein CPB86DRAFT_869332 [Serendipita vermifera]